MQDSLHVNEPRCRSLQLHSAIYGGGEPGREAAANHLMRINEPHSQPLSSSPPFPKTAGLFLIDSSLGSPRWGWRWQTSAAVFIISLFKLDIIVLDHFDLCIYLPVIIFFKCLGLKILTLSKEKAAL